MGLQHQDRQIGDYHYRVGQLAYAPTLEVFTILTQKAVPVLAQVFMGLRGSSVLDMEEQAGLAALQSAVAALDEDTLDKVVKTYASVTQVSDDAVKYRPLSRELAIHFHGGNFMSLLKWLYFATEVNFADFLDEFKGKFALALSQSQAAE